MAAAAVVVLMVGPAVRRSRPGNGTMGLEKQESEKEWHRACSVVPSGSEVDVVRRPIGQRGNAAILECRLGRVLGDSYRIGSEILVAENGYARFDNKASRVAASKDVGGFEAA